MSDANVILLMHKYMLYLYIYIYIYIYIYFIYIYRLLVYHTCICHYIDLSPIECHRYALSPPPLNHPHPSPPQLSFRSVEREIATTKQQIRDLLNQSITPLLTSSGGDVSEPSGRDGDDDRSDPSESGADTPSDRETYDTSQQQQQGEETTVLDNMIGEFEVLVNDYLCQSVREQRHDITKNIEVGRQAILRHTSNVMAVTARVA